MFSWIDNPHAGFVLAAYVVAAIALVGVGIVSLRAYRARAKEWQNLSQNHADK